MKKKYCLNCELLDCCEKVKNFNDKFFKENIKNIFCSDYKEKECFDYEKKYDISKLKRKCDNCRFDTDYGMDRCCKKKVIFDFFYRESGKACKKHVFNEYFLKNLNQDTYCNNGNILSL